MKFGAQSGGGLPKGPVDNKAERRRMILMGAALIVLVVAFVTAQLKSRRQLDQSETDAEFAIEEPLRVEDAFEVPEIDAAALEEIVRDTTELERVTLQVDAIEYALQDTSTLLDAHFEALGGQILGSELVEQLLAEPSAHRAQLVRLRGRLIELREEPRSGGLTMALGRVELEGGEPAWIGLKRVPASMGIGDYIRIDGIFVHAHRAEIDGTWVEGPVVVGPRAIRSYPRTEPSEELFPEAFALIEDAEYEGGGEIPFYERFDLLSYVKQHGSEGVDWDAAPELNNFQLGEIFNDPEKHRVTPFTIPISKLFSLSVKSANENPARLETVTEGWIANMTWKVDPGLIRFQSPFEFPELALRDLCKGKGYFLLIHKYNSKNGPKFAPFFVLTELEKVIPKEDQFVRNVLYFVIVMVLGLITLFFVLLRRDKRKADVLRQELLRRRRARRERQPVAPVG